MGRIVIRDPDFVDDYCRPHPNGVHGVYRLSYLGTGVPLSAVREQNVEITPERVKKTLDRLQERFPLGALGGYEILCTGRQLFAYDDDPASGYASGIRAPGWIALSWRSYEDLDDLLAHELAHALADHLSDTQMEYIWRELGQEPGDRLDARWERRPQERLAEYLSAALWGTPIDSRVLAANDPDPDEEVLARLRDLVAPIFLPHGRARVTIGDVPLIALRIGSTTAYVDGKPVELDVAPVIVNGRTMVGVRFVSERLGHRVDWEPKDAVPEWVYIYD